jgi:hypothetical protein
MRIISISFALFLLASTTRAQERENSVQVAESTATSLDNLPDAPKPKIEPVVRVDENTVCPAGAGRPCALLGGRRYVPDLWHMRQHDRDWAHAMRHPAILAAAGLFILATAYDIEGTNSCLRVHACREANPLMPQTPNRVWQYSAAMSVDAVGIYVFGRLKETGRGNLGFAMIAAASLVHFSFGTAGLSASHAVKTH